MILITASLGVQKQSFFTVILIDLTLLKNFTIHKEADESGVNFVKCSLARTQNQIKPNQTNKQKQNKSKTRPIRY